MAFSHHRVISFSNAHSQMYGELHSMFHCIGSDLCISVCVFLQICVYVSLEFCVSDSECLFRRRVVAFVLCIYTSAYSMKNWTFICTVFVCGLFFVFFFVFIMLIRKTPLQLFELSHAFSNKIYSEMQFFFLMYTHSYLYTLICKCCAQSALKIFLSLGYIF